MRSVRRRFRDASTASRMCSGRLLSAVEYPVPMLKPNLVAITTCSRTGASASPTTSSFV